MKDHASITNPKRVIAGRLNRAKRRPLSPAGRERLRQSAMANQPWQHATGPRTEAGKEQARKNGKKRQKGQQSVRALRGEMTEVNDLIQQMRNVVSSLPC